MSSDQHTIRKFTLQLQLPAGHETYPLQRRCSDIIKQELVTGLDGLLKTYFDESEVIKIQRIELDLGNITAADLENVFADKCLHKLSEKFKTIALQKKSGEITIKRVDKKQNVIDQFIYFLTHGQLPSLARLPSLAEWRKEVLNAITEKHEYFTVQFSAVITRNTSIARRLFFQFDKDFIEEFFYLCKPPVKKQIAESIIHDPLIIKKRVIQFSNKSVEEVFYAFVPALKGKMGEIVSSLQRMDAGNSSLQIRENFLITLFEIVSRTPAAKLIAMMQEIKEWIEKPSQEPEALLRQLKQDANEFQKKENLDTGKERDANLEKKDTIESAVFIKNAGLIIFHPFLARLFEKTGLMHNNDFIDDEARCRAVHLLQFIADGQEQLPEYLMPLNKILCGMPAEMHIDRFIELTQEEKDEAEELMQAVIGYWTILKNTSVEALQETFLQRKGKLSFIEADRFWKLQVEKSALDILLDKLPWGFSYIQLPWMKHRLITEW
jgi:hypothetical protein